jgi:hypothetical protein
MADLDARDKRASSVNVLLSFGRTLPNPTGAIGAADRAQTAYSYGGLLTADIGGPPPNPILYSPFGLRLRRNAAPRL